MFQSQLHSRYCFILWVYSSGQNHSLGKWKPNKHLMCLMLVSGIEKVNQGQEMGSSMTEGCAVFTFRKKRAVRPEGTMRKSAGRAEEVNSRCKGPVVSAH